MNRVHVSFCTSSSSILETSLKLIIAKIYPRLVYVAILVANKHGRYFSQFNKISPPLLLHLEVPYLRLVHIFTVYLHSSYDDY
jgi:hypothetical protein